MKHFLLIAITLLIFYVSNGQITNTIRFDRGNLQVSPEDSINFENVGHIKKNLNETYLYLVSFKKEVIADSAFTLGDRVIGYLPDNSFVILTTPADAETISRYPGIVYIDEYPEAPKISQRLEFLVNSNFQQGNYLDLVDEVFGDVSGIFEDDNNRDDINFTSSYKVNGRSVSRNTTSSNNVNSNESKESSEVNHPIPGRVYESIYPKLTLSADISSSPASPSPSFAKLRVGGRNVDINLSIHDTPAIPSALPLLSKEVQNLQDTIDIEFPVHKLTVLNILPDITKKSSDGENTANSRTKVRSVGVDVEDIDESRSQEKETSQHIAAERRLLDGLQASINKVTSSQYQRLLNTMTASSPPASSLLSTLGFFSSSGPSPSSSPSSSPSASSLPSSPFTANIARVLHSYDTTRIGSFTTASARSSSNTVRTNHGHRGAVNMSSVGMSSLLPLSISVQAPSYHSNSNSNSDLNAHSQTNTDTNTNSDSNSNPETESLSRYSFFNVVYQSPLLAHTPDTIARAVITSAYNRVVGVGSDDGVGSGVGVGVGSGVGVGRSSTTRSFLGNHVDSITNVVYEEMQHQRLASRSTSPSNLAERIITLSRETASILQHQHLSIARALEEVTVSLSQQPSLLHIDAQPLYTVKNKRARFLSLIGDDSSITVRSENSKTLKTPYHALGLTGKNVVVGCADTGVDVQSCYFNPKKGQTFAYNQINLALRKIVNYVAYADSHDVRGGHGTHVVGTIAGAAASADGDLLSNTGTASQNGIAPDAKISFYDIAVGDNFYLPSQLSTVFKSAASVDGHIHSNSWGCGKEANYPNTFCNTYSSSSFMADQYIHKNPQSLILFAASNDGLQFQTLGEPATAKNVVSVGALTSSLTSHKETKGFSPDLIYYSNNTLADFSSSGPTPDYRIKPDVLAPGFYLTSAGASGSNKAQYSCSTAYMAGTSMSTPTVAGTAAILEQYFKEGYYQNKKHTPAGSLLKAVLVNSGQDVPFKTTRSDSKEVSMPMKNQKTTSAQTLVDDGISHKPYLLGTIVPLDQMFKGVSFVASPKGKTNKRSYRVLFNLACYGNANIITVTSFSKNKPDKVSFSMSTVDVTPVDLENYTNDDNIYVSVTTPQNIKNACDFVEMAVLEYDSHSIDTASTYQEASCSDTIRDFPFIDLSVQNNQFPFWRYACPPDYVCADTHLSSEEKNIKVEGTSAYTLDTPICRAALHSNALNVPFPLRKLSASELTDLNTRNLRSIVNLGIYKFLGNKLGFTSRLLASDRNGVRSTLAHLSLESLMIVPYAGGYTKDPLSSSASAKEAFYHQYQDSTALPNAIQGFGAIQLDKTAVLPNTGPTTPHDRALVILGDGSEHHYITHLSVTSYCFTVNPDTTSSSASDTKVTLVWNDYPAVVGTGDVKSLVNDIDLYVYGDNSEFRGNNRVDKRNNVEQVTITHHSHTNANVNPEYKRINTILHTNTDNTVFHGSAGMYCAVIHGSYIPLGKQNYSLIVSGPGVELCGTGDGAGGVGLGGRKGEETLLIPTTYNENKGLNGVWERVPDSPKAQCQANSDFLNERKSIEIFQSGNCLRLRALLSSPINTNTNTKTNTNKDLLSFFNQRLSAPDSEDWAEAELKPHQTLYNQDLPHKFSYSGRLLPSPPSTCLFATTLGNFTDTQHHFGGGARVCGKIVDEEPVLEVEYSDGCAERYVLTESRTPVDSIINNKPVHLIDEPNPTSNTAYSVGAHLPLPLPLPLPLSSYSGVRVLNGLGFGVLMAFLSIFTINTFM